MAANLHGPPPCPACGLPLREVHHPEEPDLAEAWEYHCDATGCRWMVAEMAERLTCLTAPWTRVLAAEVESLRRQVEEVRSAGLSTRDASYRQGREDAEVEIVEWLTAPEHVDDYLSGGEWAEFIEEGAHHVDIE